MKTTCRKLYRSYKNSLIEHRDERWAIYKAHRNKYSEMILRSKEESWRKYCEKVEGARETARIHRIMASEPITIPGFLKTGDGSFTKTHTETAELLLSTHFPGSVKETDTSLNYSFEETTFAQSEVENEIITPNRIKWAIFSFDSYKSPGIDEIYPAMLQKAWDIVEPYIFHFYTASFRLSYIPKQWQKVKVTFLPKTGKDDYTIPKSFRPISLTSFLLKGMERLIDRYIRDFTIKHCPINEWQHAFQEGKSTETALHSLTNTLEKNFADKEYTICTFMDIEGAFDNVSFLSVEEALEKRNICTPIRRWIQFLLFARKITLEHLGKKHTVVAKILKEKIENESPYNSYLVHEIVLATIPGFVAWPARIKNIIGETIYVEFFGTGQVYVFDLIYMCLS